MVGAERTERPISAGRYIDAAIATRGKMRHSF